LKIRTLRIIGGPEHLNQFLGEGKRKKNRVLGIEFDVKNLSLDDGEMNTNEGSDSQKDESSNNVIDSLQLNDSNEIRQSKAKVKVKMNSPKQRNDTRKLSALLRAKKCECCRKLWIRRYVTRGWKQRISLGKLSLSHQCSLSTEVY
jgi:hypothetical protein